MTLEEAIELRQNASPGMEAVFDNIIKYLKGEIEKTPLKFVPGYSDSRCRHLYYYDDKKLYEVVLDPTGVDVLYKGEC